MADLPEGVIDFIRTRLNSVEQIAVLILLRDDPERAWTVDEISSELRSTDMAISRRLGDLEAVGVLEPADESGRWRYAPTSHEMGERVRALVECYLTRHDRVIEVIYTKPPEALLAFADAFNLKKDKS